MPPRKKAEDLVAVTSALQVPDAHVTTSAGRVRQGQVVEIPEAEAEVMIERGLIQLVASGPVEDDE